MNDDRPLTDMVIGEPKSAVGNSWLHQGLDWLWSLSHHRDLARRLTASHVTEGELTEKLASVCRDLRAADRLNADLVTEIERLKTERDAASMDPPGESALVRPEEFLGDTWVRMPPKRIIPLEVRTVETPEPGCGSSADMQHYCVLSRKSIWRGGAWRCHICGRRIPSGEPVERDVSALTRSRIAAGRVMQACGKVRFEDGRKAPTNDDLRAAVWTEEAD